MVGRPVVLAGAESLSDGRTDERVIIAQVGDDWCDRLLENFSEGLGDELRKQVRAQSPSTTAASPTAIRLAKLGADIMGTQGVDQGSRCSSISKVSQAEHNQFMIERVRRDDLPLAIGGCLEVFD